MKKVKVTKILALVLYSILLVTQAASNPAWKARIQTKLPAKASTLAYSSAGSRIAIGHPDGQVSIWNTKTGELVRLFNAHAKEVNSVQFILQDSRLLTIGDDKQARLWSTSDWSDIGVIDGVGFSGGVSPDGLWLAAQDAEQAIWIWDLASLKRIKQLTKTGIGGTRKITFTADGKYIATAYARPLLINLETTQSISFVSSEDKKTTLKIEQQQGGQVAISLGAMQDDDAPTHQVIPSMAGSFAALGRGWYGQPNFIDVWDINAMKRIGRYKSKDGGTLTSFSFDNSLLAVAGSEKVTIWRIANGKQVASVKGNGILQFSPNSIELAVTDGSNLIIYSDPK